MNNVSNGKETLESNEILESLLSDSLKDYRCNLNDDAVKKAELELNETPNDRLAAIEAFQKWIRKQDTWLTTPLDPNFLIAFLRMRKFSNLFAREALVNYWSARTSCPQWFKDVDPTSKTICEIIDCGSMLLLPGTDKNGRKVIMLRPGLVGTESHYTNNDITKTAFALGDYLVRDENVQVNGFVIITDFSYMSMRNRNVQMGVADMKTNFAIWTKVYPIRVKAIHHYNMGRLGEFLSSLARPFLPSKVQKRMFNHSTMVSLYDYIDQSMLPSEYLPDDHVGPSAGSIKQITENMKRELAQPKTRDYIRQLSSGRYSVDESLKPQDEDVLHESYRKMNV